VEIAVLRQIGIWCQLAAQTPELHIDGAIGVLGFEATGLIEQEVVEGRSL
jgi:hypothetical protein